MTTHEQPKARKHPVAIQSEVDEQVTALKEDDYTANSYKEFKTALEAAKKLENENYPNWKDFVTARDNAKEAIEDAKQHIRK